jgi:hypothetical protein
MKEMGSEFIEKVKNRCKKEGSETAPVVARLFEGIRRYEVRPCHRAEA